MNKSVKLWCKERNKFQKWFMEDTFYFEAMLRWNLWITYLFSRSSLFSWCDRLLVSKTCEILIICNVQIMELAYWVANNLNVISTALVCGIESKLFNIYLVKIMNKSHSVPLYLGVFIVFAKLCNWLAGRYLPL